MTLKIHAFTQSGLGQAPFSMATNEQLDKLTNTHAECEHCGTPLVNCYPIVSADGQVSIVGIDCLRKTSDAALISAANDMAKNKRKARSDAQKTAAHDAKEAKQRKNNNGLTNAQCRAPFELELIGFHERAEMQIIAMPVCELLEVSHFGQNVLAKACHLSELTPGTLKVCIEIVAKSLSGARKNSPPYKAKLKEATSLVDALSAFVRTDRERFHYLHHQINLINLSK